jgi:hypothetical protein
MITSLPISHINNSGGKQENKENIGQRFYFLYRLQQNAKFQLHE